MPFISVLCALFVLISACNSSPTVNLTGSIDYIGDSDFYIETIPLHYKYSKKERFEVNVVDQNFDLSIPINAPQIVYAVIQDDKYPLFLEPNTSISLIINRAEFPRKVEISGPGIEANQSYIAYLEAIDGLESAIKTEMDLFKVGEANKALELSQQKVEFAKKHLSNTDFNDLYLKTIGEDFVIQLRAVEYSDRFFKDFETEKEREKILNEASASGFFSYESLKAQRAGIRDFTHYYARTFGIYDEVKEVYGDDIAEYDIKRVAYEELNEKRLQVIEFIEDPEAKAYAELFLLAERIGEIPIQIAEISYNQYLEEFQEYTEFIEFAQWFYREIKSVSPGEPAITFTLADRNGYTFTMEDYKGKYVLLDFWAGWCQPCLEEFPIMREIYNDYTRDELEIVGISTEVDSLVWLYDIDRFENPWPQLYGGDGFEQETFKAYKGGGIPFYILVDPDGNIARYNDMRPSFNFTEVLDSLLLHQEFQKASL